MQVRSQPPASVAFAKKIREEKKALSPNPCLRHIGSRFGQEAFSTTHPSLCALGTESGIASPAPKSSGRIPHRWSRQGNRENLGSFPALLLSQSPTASLFERSSQLVLKALKTEAPGGLNSDKMVTSCWAVDAAKLMLRCDLIMHARARQRFSQLVPAVICQFCDLQKLR